MPFAARTTICVRTGVEFPRDVEPRGAPQAPGSSERCQGPSALRRSGLASVKVFMLLAAAILLASCVTILRPAPDEDVCYAPSIEGNDYFWYFSTADPFLPLHSAKAELIRLERFRRWLSGNGYESPHVEVVSKRVERTEKVFGITVYKLKYLMKVKKPSAGESKGDTTSEAGKNVQPPAVEPENTLQTPGPEAAPP